jgi:hypothetical protein
VHIAVPHVFLHQTHVASLSRQGVTAGMPESVRVDIGDTGAVSRGLESLLKASRVIGPARSESMIGLAANPGTAVEPIWWTVSRIEPSARKRSPWAPLFAATRDYTLRGRLELAAACRYTTNAAHRSLTRTGFVEAM